MPVLCPSLLRTRIHHQNPHEWPRALSKSFPWLAGQVANSNSSEGNTGVYNIEPFESTPPLIVKDITRDASPPSMSTLRNAQFPMSMLHESLLAPRRTIPSPSERSLPQPVFLLQAIFIEGGMILTVLAQHQVMDMTGQGQVMFLLHKACRGEAFTSEELELGNRTRGEAVPLFDDSYDLGREVQRWTIKPAVPADNDAPSPPKVTWANFSFSPSSLSSLKFHATQTLPEGAAYISTDDALSALIFRFVLRARLPRLSLSPSPSPSTQTTFARAVDVRRYLSLPPKYPGLLQSMSYLSYPVQQLVEAPLGAIAHALRTLVDPQTSQLAHDARALATALHRAQDKGSLSVTAALDLGTDVMLSSWAKENLYELDFGLNLGTPEAVRRPCFDPVESLVYLLPRTKEGEVVAAICLREGDLERLRKDEEFGRFGAWIG
ncbi:hypothetical protein DXG01_005883 [Tephrocybe rancida]|nr:hypothetical protein DXG01_005883 [Tephrocybe rancida]